MTTAAARPPGRIRRTSRNVGWIARHPGSFARRVLRSFRANQGFLLASAVAFNTLLSILPLMILLLPTLFASFYVSYRDIFGYDAAP